MTTWQTYGGEDRGKYRQSASIELTVKEALDQGLLSQITEHSSSDCSDHKPLTLEFGRGPRLIDMDNYANCPRCFLLRARDDDRNGLLLASKLKLRVVVQIKQASYLDNIVWD